MTNPKAILINTLIHIKFMKVFHEIISIKPLIFYPIWFKSNKPKPKYNQTNFEYSFDV
jgi:hypothetical protein